eukprot:1533793-Ditylum_brightwellii.AAC.1
MDIQPVALDAIVTACHPPSGTWHPALVTALGHDSQGPFFVVLWLTNLTVSAVSGEDLIDGGGVLPFGFAVPDPNTAAA